MGERTVSVNIAGTALFGTQRLTPQDTRTEYYQLADMATLSKGLHTIKVGIDLLHSQNRGTVEQNTAGVYVFEQLSPAVDALTAFNLGVPAAYLQSWGNPSTRFLADSQALFLQDDWQIAPRFLVKLGLRYDRESLPTFDESVYQDLQNPPATSDPLLGPTRLPDGDHSYTQLFATQKDWSSSRLSPRFSFSWQAKDPLRLYGGYAIQSGSTQLGSLFGPRLYNNRDVRTCFWTLLDPSGMALVPGAWLQPNHRYDAPPSGCLPLIAIPGSYRMPKTASWNLGFEWVPRAEHRLTLDLLHSRTRGLMNVRDVNAYVLVGGVPRRPDLRYSQVLRIDGTGESHYWGQTIAWQWKASESLTLNLSYTHSKAEDNYTDWTPDYPLQNTYDPGQEWGFSAEDQTHQVLLSGVYRSPSEHSLLRNSSIAVIAQYTSGRPYSKLVGYDQDYNGDGSADRPVGVGRNLERGPDIKAVDLRLSREFTMRKAQVEFILEIFNVFNTVNVLKVQNVLNAPAPHPYGTALEYGSMRQYQFGVKAKF